MTPSAGIFGFQGHSLTREEEDFFREANPYGYILFARNCESPEQIRALTDSLKELHAREHLPILIDQEGGRVARLKPPRFRPCPSAGALACLREKEEAIYLNARLIAHELRSLGVTVDCAPVADIPVEGAHGIIGDRAYGFTVKEVASLAGVMAKGLLDGGIVPVVKHIPGHGRARVDSHEELPVVDTPVAILRETDFAAFRELAYLPMAMTAHVVYTAVDAKRLATLSPAVIGMIREEIGFDGLLMSDDLSMKAMEGGFAERARAALSAGCDVALHCNGDMEEMKQVARGLSPLTPDAQARSARAFAMAESASGFDIAGAESRLKYLFGVAA